MAQAGSDWTLTVIRILFCVADHPQLFIETPLCLLTMLTYCLLTYFLTLLTAHHRYKRITTETHIVDGDRSADNSTRHNCSMSTDAETVINGKHKISPGIPLRPIATRRQRIDQLGQTQAVLFFFQLSRGHCLQTTHTQHEDNALISLVRHNPLFSSSNSAEDTLRHTEDTQGFDTQTHI